MVKIAITSQGPTLDDHIDTRFGRAAGFIIIDPHAMTFDYLDNGACQVRGQGAGIQAAETVARAGAEAVLTGYVGPKAFKALSAAGIKIGADLHDVTVREAVRQFNEGRITWTDRANR